MSDTEGVLRAMDQAASFVGKEMGAGTLELSRLPDTLFLAELLNVDGKIVDNAIGNTLFEAMSNLGFKLLSNVKRMPK